ncbi:thiamine phosphate synthase [Myroides pelagicus]|uniref:Thiamine phosphate synthase n=1 Tax=Myroides pelagicus TaxID=270914 RepID=A0A7K1GL39_9FLAO|nr:thiamine phosphate synthase [Myroides pelagicus]MEC4112604.1 thiamine phosphate synthase [Myroides pelagicus]MTH29518.1 thiamine phosphate synthase [Myroides pelagicus]
MVIITYPNDIKNEASLINTMFDKGLSLLHVRKPDMSIDQLFHWIETIETHHRKRLVIHIPKSVINNKKGSYQQYITLINNFNLDYIHLSTVKDEFINMFTSYIPKLSTSVHNISEANNLPTQVSRSFISPIYPSISKPGYQSSIDWTIELRKRTNDQLILIALGGIQPQHIKTLAKIGVDDYALLGSLWTSINPITTFDQCLSLEQKYWINQRNTQQL